MNLLSKFLPATFAVLAASLLRFTDAADARKELFFERLQELDFAQLEQDIIDLINSSDPDFPSDYGNYGPFFIRMAWHCAGTYRITDGEGGCDGGRQRFDPERSWDDNTQLDKARGLLFDIKQKYGPGLSWGDLISLAGTLAIQDMGGPNIGFCYGRFDDLTGEESLILGPSDSQEETAPCPPEQNGDCQPPLGPNTLELIYVNPGGFLGVPEPSNSVAPIRDTFGRMGFNDSETVALIGGGHAFGKCHGACPDGPGPAPDEQPEDPWPGNCGTGVGRDTFTSGFEGPWTTTPFLFTNNFFRALVNFDWELFVGPGGANTFQVEREEGEESPLQAPNVDFDGTQQTIMLTTDLALLEDPSYRSFVDMYAASQEALAASFGPAWYKLLTRDMGPVTRCFGPNVPPPQEFQAPLPDAPAELPDFNVLADAVNDKLNLDSTFFPADDANGEAYNGAWLIELAYLCASTFRTTDNNGGCNGARIRLSPEIDWADREGMREVLNLIDAINFVIDQQGGQTATTADAIVFAATQALQVAGEDEVSFTFCPGRADADSAPVSDGLQLFRYEDKALEQRRQARLFGISALEYVALQGRPRSAEYMRGLGYSGSYTNDASVLSNVFAQTLLSEEWTMRPGTGDLIFGAEYVNADGDKFITFRDFVLLLDPDFLAALFELAGDNQFFLNTFASTWTKLMNADRFDGPVQNLCENGAVEVIDLADLEPVDGGGNGGNGGGNGDNGSNDDIDEILLIAIIAGVAVLVLILAVIIAYNCGKSRANTKVRREAKEMRQVNPIVGEDVYA